MKNNTHSAQFVSRGFAPLLILLVVVLVGGGTYAVVQRSVLKSYFQTGDKPTEAQFADTIDSSLNLQDDSKLLGLKEYDTTKQYEAGDTAVQSQPIYQAKVVAQAQTEFKLDKTQPVTFRWTAASKSQGAVTYRLKVWQLMQGQNGTTAMKLNQPVVTKDVTNSTEATVSGLYTGPCKPPYLCDFVWSVEVLSKTDTKAGTGETTTPAATGATAPTESTGAPDGTR